MTSSSENTLERAYSLIKLGDKDAARELLTSFLKEEPGSEEAWSLLYYCVDSPQARIDCLRKVLEINPDNRKARQALDKLSAAAPEGSRLPTWGRWPLALGGLVLLAGICLAALGVFNDFFAPATPPPTPTASVTPTPSATHTFTPLPTDTPLPTATPLPTLTFTFTPTSVVITFTPVPSDTPTITPVPTATLKPGARGRVQITYINYIGSHSKSESDEYVEFANLGDAPVDMKGWSLYTSAQRERFRFPNFTIQPGQACRIYTNEIHPEHCAFSFNRDHSVWNDHSDCARIFSDKNVIVDEYCYKANK